MPTEIPGCQSGAIIGDDISEHRKRRFTDYKKKVLDTTVPDGDENVSIPMSLKIFLSLLQGFADDIKNYDGMRVYYAAYSAEEGAKGVPPGNEGKLTVLFVPTLGGKDDPDSYYHLYDANLTLLPRPSAPNPDPDPDDLVTTWINNYRNFKLKPLEDDGKQVAGDSFQETRSLWYPIVIIRGEEGATPANGKEQGLLKYIRCGQGNGDNPIIGMSVLFATFLEDESPRFRYNYQMTLVFNLRQQKDPGFVNLSFGSGTLFKMRAVPADTGLPCPPNGTCANPYQP